jgi:hypothetical protein
VQSADIEFSEPACGTGLIVTVRLSIRAVPPAPWVSCSALLACVLAWAGAARAQTDEIQVYDAEITPPGRFSLTWHNNFTASGRRQAAFPAGVIPEHALNGVPEWAYGVTDWLEAGTYLPVYTRTRDGRLLFDGVKLRALLVVPDAHERTVFYGLNFEFSYNTPHWDTSRFTGEIRPIIGVHLGRLDLIVNPILDTDFDGLGKTHFAPATRIAYRIGGKLALALEHYADLGPQPSQSLFGVFDYGSSTGGIEFGVGRGLTHSADSCVLKLMLMRDL